MEKTQFTPPAGYVLDPEKGRYFHEQIGKNEAGETVRQVSWFDPATGATARWDYVIKPTKATEKLYGYPKGNARRNAWISVVCGLLVVVLLGGIWLGVNKGTLFSGAADADYAQSNTALFYGGLIARQDGYVFFSDIQNGGVLCVMDENDPDAQARVLTDIPAVNICLINNTLYFTDTSGSFYLRETDEADSMELLPEDARNVTGLLDFQCLEDRIVWGGKLYCIPKVGEYLKNGSDLSDYEPVETPNNGSCYGFSLEKGAITFTQAQIAINGNDLAFTNGGSTGEAARAQHLLNGASVEALRLYPHDLRRAADAQAKAQSTGFLRNLGKATQDYYNELAEAAGTTPIHLIEPTRAEIDAQTREIHVKEAESWVKLNEQVPEGYSYGGITYTTGNEGRYSYAYYRSDDYDKKPILIELDHGTGEQTVSYVKGPPKVVDGTMYCIEPRTGALLEYDGSTVSRSITSLPVDSFAFTEDGSIVVTYTGDEGEPQSALITKKPYTEEYVKAAFDENVARGSLDPSNRWYTHTAPPDSIIPEAIKGNFVDASDHPYGSDPQTYYEIAYAGGDEVKGAYYNKVTVTYDSDGNRIKIRTPAWNMRVPPEAMTPEWLALYHARPSIVANTLRSEALRAAEEERQRIVPPGYHLEPVDGDWFKGANIVQDEPAVGPEDAAKAAIEIARDDPSLVNELYPEGEREKILDYYADHTDPENSVIRWLISGSSCLHGDPLVDDVFDAWKDALEYEVSGSRISGDTAAVDILIHQNVDLQKDYEYFSEHSVDIIFAYCDEHGIDLMGADNDWYNDMVAESSINAPQNGALAKDVTITLTLTRSEDNQWVLENPQEALDRVMVTNSYLADNARQTMGQLSPEPYIRKWEGEYASSEEQPATVQYDDVLQRTQITATVNDSSVTASFYDHEAQDGFFSAYYYAQDANPGDMPLGHVYGTNADGELHMAYMKLSRDEATMSVTDVSEADIVSYTQRMQ